MLAWLGLGLGLQHVLSLVKKPKDMGPKESVLLAGSRPRAKGPSRTARDGERWLVFRANFSTGFAAARSRPNPQSSASGRPMTRPVDGQTLPPARAPTSRKPTPTGSDIFARDRARTRRKTPKTGRGLGLEALKKRQKEVGKSLQADDPRPKVLRWPRNGRKKPKSRAFNDDFERGLVRRQHHLEARSSSGPRRFTPKTRR